VQGGRILLGGQDIARVTQESLRSAVAVVPQDISLFHRSIMENVRYGRPEASDAQVHEAIVAANCSAFIENLPEGVATIVGDRGVKLSPGQRQRIGIAPGQVPGTSGRIEAAFCDAGHLGVHHQS
jgi:ATP-binding cassette subfamily B protein